MCQVIKQIFMLFLLHLQFFQFCIQKTISVTILRSMLTLNKALLYALYIFHFSEWYYWIRWTLNVIKSSIFRSSWFVAGWYAVASFIFCENQQNRSQWTFPEEADLQISSREQIICHVKNVSCHCVVHVRCFIAKSMDKQINAKLEETISAFKQTWLFAWYLFRNV